MVTLFKKYIFCQLGRSKMTIVLSESVEWQEQKSVAIVHSAEMCCYFAPHSAEKCFHLLRPKRQLFSVKWGAKWQHISAECRTASLF
jgi:hypothetical protein